MNRLPLYIVLFLSLAFAACQKDTATPNPAPNAKTTTLAEDIDLRVFPNPATIGSPIRVNYTTPDEALGQLTAVNIYGESVFDQALAFPVGGQQSASIPTNGWPEGVYFVTFRLNNYENTQAIVVKK